MNWQDEYERKRMSAAQAVGTIASGETVVIPVATEPVSLSRALMNRSSELSGVNILIRMPRCDFGWFSRDFGGAFNVLIDTQPGAAGARAINEKEIDYLPALYGLRFKSEEDLRRPQAPIDTVMIVVSPPDSGGFCSFGPYLSHKKDYVKRAKKVLAEVDTSRPMSLRLPGDNFVHVSEIDAFAEHQDIPVREAEKKTDEIDRQIAAHVADLIRDGDTIQLGPGLPAALAALGVFNARNDLGVHAPIVWPGMIDLVRKGIITGRNKNIDTEKCVSSGFRGNLTAEQIDFVDANMRFEVRSSSYVNNHRIIAAIDRMVSVNGILSVDLDGQVAADSIGKRMFGGAGGLVDFNLCALQSKGGSSILVLRSTLKEGQKSRIVSSFSAGTLVTIPWTYVDCVVTEYGVARLLGKTRRQRARELIAVAHPDFRDTLAKDLEKLSAR